MAGMNIRIIYHSKTGNTKKVAEAMAASLGIRAEAMASAGQGVAADLLVLGGAVYATSDHDLDPALERFIAGLDPARVKRAVVFSTGFSEGNLERLRARLAARGIPVAPGGFYCKGRFALFNRKHPDATDLAAAAAFARDLVRAG